MWFIGSECGVLKGFQAGFRVRSQAQSMALLKVFKRFISTFSESEPSKGPSAQEIELFISYLAHQNHTTTTMENLIFPVLGVLDGVFRCRDPYETPSQSVLLDVFSWSIFGPLCAIPTAINTIR